MSEQVPNQWVDRFTNHSVQASLAGAETALKAAETTAKSDYAAVNSVTRIGAILARLRAAFAECDPSLVPMSSLDNLNGSVVPAASEMNLYAANGNVGHLTNANNHADGILLFIPSLPVTRTPASVKVLGEAITSFRRAVDTHVAGIRAEAITTTTALETLRSQMTALEGEISTQRARLDAAISQFQTQAATSEADRAARFTASELNRQEQAAANEEARRAANTAAILERKTAFDARLDEARASFDALDEESAKTEAERVKAFTANVDAQNKASEALSAELKKAAEVLSTELRTSAEAVVALIEGEKSKAEKIVHVVGNTGMVGGYQKTANEEQKSARAWSNVTVGAMILLVLAAILTLVTAPPNFTWSYLAIRAFVATAVAILATYAGSQASWHRDEERRRRTRELEIASIDPYLALLPEVDRNAVKRLLAERMFAQPETSREPEKGAPTGSVVDLAKGGMDAAKTAFEALKSIADRK